MGFCFYFFFASLSDHSQIIVAVNKLDSVGWSAERYEEIVQKMRDFLRRRAGYREQDIHFVPISGLDGTNLTNREGRPEALQAWWGSDRPCLTELIDQLQPPVRRLDHPTRFSAANVFRDAFLGGLVVSGKVEAGMILTGDCLLVRPSNALVQVKTILKDEDFAEGALAGDAVELVLQDSRERARTSAELEAFFPDGSNPLAPSSGSGDAPHTLEGLIRKQALDIIRVGDVLCDPVQPIPLVRRFQAQIITCDYKFPILKG